MKPHVSPTVLFVFLLSSTVSLADPPANPCSAAPRRSLVVAQQGGQYTTIQDALNAAGPGDEVLVKAGRYGGNISFPRNGAAGACIVLRGEPGAVVSGGHHGIDINSRRYVSVRSLTISGQRGSDTPVGIWASGSSSFIEIKGNTVENVVNTQDAHGIAFYGTGSNPMHDLVLQDNEIRNCKLGSSETLVLNGNVENFLISGNKIHDNDNIGIDLIGYEGKSGDPAKDFARNGYIRNNQVWNISSKNNPAYKGELSADGIYVDGGRGINIEGNKVSNCDVGIEVASEHGGKGPDGKPKTATGIIVAENTISGSYQGNINIGGYDAARGHADNIQVTNNHLSGAKGEAEIMIQYYTNGVQIQGNQFEARDLNVTTTGTGNYNICFSGNKYSRSPSSRDLARFEGSCAMIQDNGRLTNQRVAPPAQPDRPPASRAVLAPSTAPIQSSQRTVASNPASDAAAAAAASSRAPAKTNKISRPTFRAPPVKDWREDFWASMSNR